MGWDWLILEGLCVISINWVLFCGVFGMVGGKMGMIRLELFLVGLLRWSIGEYIWGVKVGGKVSICVGVFVRRWFECRGDSWDVGEGIELRNI